MKDRSKQLSLVVVECWLEARASFDAHFQRRHSCALHAATGGTPWSATTAETRVSRKKAQTDSTEVFCSFIFPPGYSIYVEEFILNDFGPDNFVLLDGKPLQYSPKLEWGDRRRIFWDALGTQALKENALRRSAIPCVKSLKVI